MDPVDNIISQWQTSRPDLDISVMAPIGRLSRVFQIFSREMGANFSNYGLHASGFDMLATLRRSPPPHSLSPGELMASMMITSGTITNRIDQLIKAGLVCRTQDPEDARRAFVTLTDEGFELIEKVIDEHVKVQKSLMAGLSDTEIKQLDTLLTKLMSSADQTES